MKVINRILYLIYVISMITSLVFLVIVLASGVYRIATGEAMMFLYGIRVDILGYSIAGVFLSAFLSNQIDKLIKRKNG